MSIYLLQMMIELFFIYRGNLYVTGISGLVSDETVRNRLREGGLFHRVPAKREDLTPAHIRARLNFFEEHRLVYGNNWHK